MEYKELDDYIEYALYPALYEKIDRVFPELHFQLSRDGSKWISRHHLNDRERDSQGHVVSYVYKNNNFCAIDMARGDKPSLINLYIDINKVDYKSALTKLSEFCNLTPPSVDSEEWKERRKKDDERARARNVFTTALWNGSEEAGEVLTYLHSRNWTDAEIKKAELGLITNEIRNSLPDGDNYSGWYNSNGKKADGTKENTHTLVIPYKNGSRIFGFKFREPRAELLTGQKYTSTKGMETSKGFFGISTGVTDITIVEGEMDALHANTKLELLSEQKDEETSPVSVDGKKYKRTKTNVVATSGSGASKGQIEDAIRRGVKRFTLLFDSDEKGKSFVEPTIKIIEATGAEIYVAEIPEGQGKDVDEYLAKHTIEDFINITEAAVPYFLYRTDRLIEKYKDIEKKRGIFEHKDRENFIDELTGILNANNMNNERREFLKEKLKEYQGLPIGLDGFFEDADRDYYRRLSKMRADEVRKAFEDINNAIKRNDIDCAVRLMGETASSVEIQDKIPEFTKVFATHTPQEISKFLGEIKEGIPTGYKFERGNIKESFTLNSGLTFICGYRGHGKTSFLNNIALNEARRLHDSGSNKSVLYFSYEVDKRRLLIDLLNTFVNDEEISANPTRTIQGYFNGKGDKYFCPEKYAKPRADGKTHFENFEEQKDIFFKNYLNGRIIVVDENYKVGKLLDAIKFYMKSHEVSIVCIDYAQLIYSEDSSRLRTEEIKKVVNDIKDYANKCGVPFVLAAQFNRQVDSPLDIDTKNIGEGGDFERIADTCIGLFNLKELHPLPKNREEEKEAKRLLQGIGVANYEDGDKHWAKPLEPIEGKIFVRLMKRRYGYCPLDTILDWQGKTKFIYPNAPEELSPYYSPEQDLTDTTEIAPF